MSRMQTSNLNQDLLLKRLLELRQPLPMPNAEEIQQPLTAQMPAMDTGGVNPVRPSSTLGQEQDRLDQIRAAQTAYNAPKEKPGFWMNLLQGTAEGLAYGNKAPQVRMQRDELARQKQMDLANEANQIRQGANQRQQGQLQIESANRAQSEEDRNAKLFPAQLAGAQAQAKTAEAASNRPHLNEIGPGNALVDDKGQLIFERDYKATTPKSLQTKDVDDPDNPGKPLQAIFNTETGKTFHPTTGREINNPKPFVKAAAEGGSYIPLTNAAGEVVGAWNPKSGDYVDAPKGGLRKTADIPTGEERKAGAFQERMKSSKAILDQLEPEIVKLDAGGQARLNYAPNIAQTTIGQKYNQAKDDFINAALRRESGAAISQAEYNRFNDIYFAKVGDTPEKLAQKAAARKEVVDSVEIEAGRAGAGARGGSAQAPIVQHSTSTGAYRYSLDGGKTWLNGQPPSK